VISCFSFRQEKITSTQKKKEQKKKERKNKKKENEKKRSFLSAKKMNNE
jgi:hypothetical protein